MCCGGGEGGEDGEDDGGAGGGKTYFPSARLSVSPNGGTMGELANADKLANGACKWERVAQ